MKKTFSFFLLTFFLNVSGAQIISTQFGNIQGAMNGTVYQFLGIPFAKPPVGVLRWQAPQDPSFWTGIKNTNTFAPVCPQKRYQQGDTTYTIEGDEDCLYLNIWTPQTITPTLPVLVFIHGGGNQQGGASEISGGTQIYFGKNMAERGNAVVVTIQYRLGPLGFLVHPGLEAENSKNISGNYAILDQILALKWVKNNITSFGGDTTKVMIFGESAGGVDVGDLLVSPMATSLFQRACIESASPVINDYTDSKNKGIAFVDSFISTGTSTQKIAYMRSLPADSLVKNLISPLAGGIAQMEWQPVIDNVVFPDYPLNSLQNGTNNKVSLMIGSNSDEMNLTAPAVVTPAMVTTLINAYVPVSLRTLANTLYPPGSNNTQARQSYVGILTDKQFTTMSRRTARCVSSGQAQPVWRYFFTYKSPITQLAALGSYHGLELFYVFNTWEKATLGSGIFFKPQDDSLQKNMLQYWVNFANTGNPNGNGLVSWPQYQNPNDCYMEIKATPNGNQCGLRTQQSNLWDSVQAFTSCSVQYNNLYMFNGNGNWDYPGNWLISRVPPATLNSGSQIIVDPISAGECFLNIPYKVSPGSSLIVMPNKKFRIPDKLTIH